MTPAKDIEALPDVAGQEVTQLGGLPSRQALGTSCGQGVPWERDKHGFRSLLRSPVQFPGAPATVCPTPEGAPLLEGV